MNLTWNDFVKTHPDARLLRARAFENYDQLCTIFGQYDVRMKDISISPAQCDRKLKDQGKHFRWTNEMDSCLSRSLAEQVKLGNKNRLVNKLKPVAYEAAVTSINEIFQLDITKYHVRNHLKTWKKQYDILRELLDETGFQWDKKERMVVANNIVWNEYIKINPDARLLKGRVIKNYDQLCIIFGDDDLPESSRDGAGTNLDLITDDEAVDAQEAYSRGCDNAKEKVKYLVWTDEMDRCLTELLVKQVMLGNKLEKNFKHSAFVSAAKILSEKFVLDITKENIRNRLITWKKKYGLVKELLSHGGFEWDEKRKMVVANDSEWNEYIERHPDARHLRARCIENYDELAIIVGNEQTSGNLSGTLRLDVNHTSIHEQHAETPAQMLDDEERSHDNASDGMQASSQQTRARPSSSHSKQPLKRKRTSENMLEMMSAMAADIGRIADALIDSQKTVSLNEVFEMVQNIPGFDDDLIIEACEFLSFDEKRALMFMKLDERLRKKWLLKRLCGRSS
ncbi:L10-interacting MYB domain-containing protein [Quillaja saponaria]|uniref:L10-interacting MYB domain-containing protein n=1 Tax=Quillaja saponaria TaxID=32244 RepID=A0AAD7LLT0_QUISA|nr:L10-interacting MYB domain-containing protein [Quillaja saponaria]